MILGVPKEIKEQEGRVSLVPAGVHELVAEGHEVLVQQGAGLDSAIRDEQYLEAGARVLASAEEVWAKAEIIVKVKEPLANEYPLVRKGQTLFTYFHFAASRELTDHMLASGAYCFAYETLEQPGVGLPLLTPMSEVAGRMSIQEGVYHLKRAYGGSGILIGGVPGTEPGKILILGAGVVGTEAARMAAGLGARVFVLDVNLERLRELSFKLPGNVFLLHSSAYTIREHLRDADLVVGAVLVKGARAPTLVRRRDLALMQKGSVIVDVAVDQGGCVESARPTTHQEPTYIEEGIVHYCVANIPGAVPRTSTYALTNATQPFVSRLAALGPVDAIREDPMLASAANIVNGMVTNSGVADSFVLDYVDPAESLGRG